jgi:hypothetical protein
MWLFELLCALLVSVFSAVLQPADSTSLVNQLVQWLTSLLQG